MAFYDAMFSRFWRQMHQQYSIVRPAGIAQGGDVTTAELARAGWNGWLAASAAALV